MWRTLDFNLPELLKPLCPIKTDGTNFFITQKTSLNVKRDEFIIFLDGGTIIKFCEKEWLFLLDELDNLRKILSKNKFFQKRLSVETSVENRVRFFLFSHVRKEKYV